MTTTNERPQLDPNSAQSSAWVAHIGGLEGIAFKLKDFQLPAVSLGRTDLGGTSHYGMTVSGNRLVFDDLQISYLIDSTYKNYDALLDWLVYNASSNVQKELPITVHMLDGVGKYQGVAYEFFNAFPTMVGPAVLDTENATTDVMGTGTFTYTHFARVRDEQV